MRSPSINLTPYIASRRSTYRRPYAFAATAPSPYTTPGFGYTSSGTYPTPTQLPPPAPLQSRFTGVDVNAPQVQNPLPPSPSSSFSLNSIADMLKSHWIIILGVVIALVVVLILSRIL